MTKPSMLLAWPFVVLAAITFADGPPESLERLLERVEQLRYPSREHLAPVYEEQWASRSEIYYLRARYYRPEVGRFWTRDTYEGNSSDPLSLHKYLYCHDDPVNAIDPSGQFELNTTQIATAISVGLNAYSAYNNIQQKRYAWAAVDILAAAAGIGGFGGPGLFKQVAFANGVRGSLTAAQLAAGAQGLREISQAWALIDLIMMAQAEGGGDGGLSSGSGDVNPEQVNRIPATTEASVTDKLARYLLNANHPIGGPKANFFKRALGFDPSNAADLAKQLVFDSSKATATQLTQHGQKYEQIIEVTGANGRIIEVPFIWIKNNDGVVRLVTAIPNTL